MIEYRLIITKKPTLRLWRIEGKKKRVMAEVQDEKAYKLKEHIIPQVKLTSILQWRDGRALYHVDEETFIRLFLSMKLIIGVRNPKRLNKLVDSLKYLERGEMLAWYSLYLKLGFKAMSAMRVAYL